MHTSEPDSRPSNFCDDPQAGFSAQLGKHGQIRSQTIKRNPKNMNTDGLVEGRIPMSESALVDVEKSSLWN